MVTSLILLRNKYLSNILSTFTNYNYNKTSKYSDQLLKDPPQIGQLEGGEKFPNTEDWFFYDFD
jgi:hypothetical protein